MNLKELRKKILELFNDNSTEVNQENINNLLLYIEAIKNTINSSLIEARADFIFSIALVYLKSLKILKILNNLNALSVLRSTPELI